MSVLDILAEARAVGALGAADLAVQVAHATAFLDVLGSELVDGARVLDLGSGGGLPGLVVADLRPSLHVTLLDGRQQRAATLERAVERLGWAGRVDVVGARAELAGRDPGLRGAFDAVVARSFARPGVTAECAAPLLRAGGSLVVSEPPDAASTGSRWDAGGCAELGLELVRVVETPWSFALLRQVRPCPERFPRRVGVPTKRPLF